MTKPLLLIEHGQTAFDEDGRVHGRFDPPLNDSGREQARRLGARLLARRDRPQVLFSSPRRRALETARIAAKIAGMKVRVAPELAPLNVGDFSGQPEKQVAERLRPYFAAPWKRIPGGDSVASWRAQGRAFASRVPPGSAVVAHSNVIGNLVARARGSADGRHAMANPPTSGSITVVRYPAGGKA